MQSPFERGPRSAATPPLFAERSIDLEPQPPEPTTACAGCDAAFSASRWAAELHVCPVCGLHGRIGARERIALTADAGSFAEMPLPAVQSNPLGFPAYEEKLEKGRAATELRDALLAGTARIGGYACALAAMDTGFMMGSMGAAVGEGLSALSDLALEQGLPLAVFCCSGGARMQEGMVSLLQMAKVSMSFERLAQRGLPYFAVLTDPTTGGVTASFAMLGDVILAEPGALIGFTGPRVIAQTIRQELPEGFQRSEFLLEHGFIDLVKPRREMRDTLRDLLMLHGAKHE
jgi:acetyl-CoA carboxylase carboxyl transferase subunit beta